MIVKSLKTRLFKEGEELPSFIYENVKNLGDGDVLVITSKIAALAENRVAPLAMKEDLVRKESKEFIDTPWAALTLTDDGWCINAGVDESNAQGKLILLPLDPQNLAKNVRLKLREHFNVKNVGVLITDTKSLPLRAGTIGRALAWSGFEPLKSYIGKKDLYGKESRVTQSNVPDALAAAAVLEMGEGDEQMPLCVISGADLKWTEKEYARGFLALPAESDMFGAVYKKRRP